VMKELPKKIESVLKLPLTDTQSKKYNQLLEAHKKILEKSHQKDLSTTNLQLLAYPNEAISQNKESIKSWIGRMMELRKVANHPVLVRSFYTEEKLKKMASLILLGEKVLVFSQFTSVLDILEYALKEWNIVYTRLDGQTKTSERQEMIETFNELSDIKVFLLSTKAGGFGINLASANVVVIHDVDINPHNDRQAEDRAHRVGQSKDVKVIKLIAKDTVEEEILEQAKTKLLLDENISKANLLAD
ncbi:hypothetical protein BB560_003611, partial [Smittium megazygosporum]